MNQWIVVNDETGEFWPLEWDGTDADTAMELAYNFSGFDGTRAYIQLVGDDVPAHLTLAP